MKQNEITSRQDRVVYILLVLVGALGLTWAIWEHWYHAKEKLPSATHAPAGPAVWAHRAPN